MYDGSSIIVNYYNAIRIPGGQGYGGHRRNGSASTQAQLSFIRNERYQYNLKQKFPGETYPAQEEKRNRDEKPIAGIDEKAAVGTNNNE